MKWSFKIADIAGIKVQVHLTFVIIVAWLFGSFVEGSAGFGTAQIVSALPA